MGLLYGRAGRLTAKNGGFRRGQGALKVLGLESEAQDYAPPREIVDALSAEGQARGT